jgi:hypothetical protein
MGDRAGSQTATITPVYSCRAILETVVCSRVLQTQIMISFMKILTPFGEHHDH